MDLASRVQHLESLYGYETRKSLGAGSFGTVLHAVRVGNPDNNAAVAVKMFANLEEYDEELVYLRRTFGSTRVVQMLFDFEAIGGIALELADGSLHDAIVQVGVFEGSLIKSAVRDIATGIAELHKLGIAHLDLKPANILRFGCMFKVADLGLCRPLDLNGNLSGTAGTTHLRVQTEFFRAPELFEYAVNSRSGTKADMWTLGRIVQCMLHGDPYYPPPCGDYLSRSRSHLPWHLSHLLCALLSPVAHRCDSAALVVSFCDEDWWPQFVDVESIQVAQPQYDQESPEVSQQQDEEGSFVANEQQEDDEEILNRLEWYEGTYQVSHLEVNMGLDSYRERVQAERTIKRWNRRCRRKKRRDRSGGVRKNSRANSLDVGREYTYSCAVS